MLKPQCWDDQFTRYGHLHMMAAIMQPMLEIPRHATALTHETWYQDSNSGGGNYIGVENYKHQDLRRIEIPVNLQGLRD